MIMIQDALLACELCIKYINQFMYQSNSTINQPSLSMPMSPFILLQNRQRE